MTGLGTSLVPVHPDHCEAVLRGSRVLNNIFKDRTRGVGLELTFQVQRGACLLGMVLGGVCGWLSVEGIVFSLCPTAVVVRIGRLLVRGLQEGAGRGR
jgi:hypothetical protein